METDDSSIYSCTCMFIEVICECVMSHDLGA